MSQFDFKFCIGDIVIAQMQDNRVGTVTEVWKRANGDNLYKVQCGDAQAIWEPEYLLSPVQPGTPAPNGMEYFLLRLDCCLGSEYYATIDKFLDAADSLLRQKRPYHGYEWDVSKGRYVLGDIGHHPYPQP